MRYPRRIQIMVILIVLALFVAIDITDAMARGGGGGGGFGGGGGGGIGGGGGRGGGIRSAPPGSYRMRRAYSPYGPARGGSLVSTPSTRPSSRDAERPATGSRQTPANPAVAPQGNPNGYQNITQKYEKLRKDHHKNYWDSRERQHHRVALGTVYAAAEFNEENCENTVVVEGVSHYECGGIWHKRAYSGGEVVYMVVDKPPDQ